MQSGKQKNLVAIAVFLAKHHLKMSHAFPFRYCFPVFRLAYEPFETAFRQMRMLVDCCTNCQSHWDCDQTLRNQAAECVRIDSLCSDARSFKRKKKQTPKRATTVWNPWKLCMKLKKQILNQGNAKWVVSCRNRKNTTALPFLKTFSQSWNKNLLS